jgi:hypothetical protein
MHVHARLLIRHKSILLLLQRSGDANIVIQYKPVAIYGDQGFLFDDNS